MIRQYRAWLPDQEEPTDFPIQADSPERAASNLLFHLNKFHTMELPIESRLQSIADLQENPKLVLVREDGFQGSDPHRIHVTAAVEIQVWGYPADFDSPDTP
jgi:hypothetical protein